MMKDKFLKIADHTELASFFGVTYAQLSKIIYKTSPEYKYKQFEILKKNGGKRTISSPSKKLKKIQRDLASVLYEIYPGKPSVHGFSKRKSIVTNAERHLDKKYIFNIDLENYFSAIHFGRVRNLFKSSPFSFNHSVSTILAQICCFNNELPQGAPTSPIISNMITWKLDSKLQQLAKITNCTYTRYADDISFSFTCNKQRLPEEILIVRDDACSPGHALTHIIEENGFNINYGKVRLCSKISRMEVTGLTVNEFVNVDRKYVRQISSMLYAWREHGYKLAELEFNEKYDRRHRASSKPKSLLFVVKGKLAFLKSVRSGRSEVYQKLAKKFNDLVDEKYRFKLLKTSPTENRAIESLWVIEACYDENGEVKTHQGTGFQLEGVGIITCAHVVSENGKLFNTLEAYKHWDTTTRYKIIVERKCDHRDVAICRIEDVDMEALPCIAKSDKPVTMMKNVALLGFPAYAPGSSYFMADTQVVKIYPQSGVQKFEVHTQIRAGNSGGPIIDGESSVVGVALEGASKDAGNNGCLDISEIVSVLGDDKYKI